MATKIEIKLDNGMTLKGWYWKSSNPKVNLAFVPGMAEYAYRFSPLMEYLTTRGINVYSIDTIGQGLNVSSRDELEIWPKDGFDLNVEGIHKLILLAKENGLPTVQMGHSMGSLLTQRRMQLYPDDVSKTILMGTNGGQAFLMKFGYFFARILVNDRNWNKRTPKFQAFGLKTFSRGIKNPKTKYDWISYNEANVNAYINDPLCACDNTCGFWKEFIKGMSILWDHKEMIKINKNQKIYITSGEDDGHGRFGLGPNWLIKEYKKLGVAEVRYKFYPNMRHEIHNEDGKDEVYNDLANEILNY